MMGALNTMTRVFRKEGRGRFGHRDTDKQKRRPYVMEAESGMMELQAKGHTGLAETKRSWQRHGGFFPRALGQHGLWTLWFQTPSLRNACCSKPPRLWYFVTAALGN